MGVLHRGANDRHQVRRALLTGLAIAGLVATAVPMAAPVAAQDDYAARAARAEMAIKARQRLLETRSGEGV